MNILVRLTYVLVLIVPFSPPCQRLNVGSGKPLFFAQWSIKFDLWHRFEIVSGRYYCFQISVTNKDFLGRW